MSRERRKNEQKLYYRGFDVPGWLYFGGKRSSDYLPDRTALNAQSTRHGARPGPKHAPSVYAPPLRAPQPRAREKTRGRRRKAGRRVNVCTKVLIYLALWTEMYPTLVNKHQHLTFLTLPSILSRYILHALLVLIECFLG